MDQTDFLYQLGEADCEPGSRSRAAAVTGLLAAAINLYRGEVTNRAVAETFNLPYDARFESGEAKT